MIISHSRKFVFIKTRKTASTSVEHFLHASLNSRDIWTPLSNPRTPGHRYYSAWPPDWLAAKSSRFRRFIGKRSPLYRRYLADHSPILAALPLIGPDYFKFCFDRNPWDFVVSLYFHQKAKGRTSDFDEFVFNIPFVQNWTLYTIDDRPAVDAVYRYEDLGDSLKKVSERLGLVDAPLPAHKTTHRTEIGYRQYYSQRTRDEVAARWAKTIAYLRYDF